MGITDFPENLQQKMNDLFRGFEFIRVYIDELLILTKGYCTDHVHKLEFIENSGILCMIILTWEGYCYKQLPMGITDFPENLQQKIFWEISNSHW